MKIYSVQELNEATKNLLESEFLSIAITGEISNFSRPRSGHWYFTLKDDQAQIRAAMFKFRNQFCGLEPKDGIQVIAYGKVSLYPARGDYQLIIDRVEPAGLGNLQQAYEKLKRQLSQLGWFDEGQKQSLPTYPEGIAVVTSPTGAAIRDILSVLKRRAPSIPIKIFPTPVQGATAAAEIVQQIQHAEQDAETQVIVLARGGGSLEDLWCFNEEKVAKAIRDCQKPIVSGVGHETDFTIADFVADLRAPTPSAAAELVSFDQAALLTQLTYFQNQLLQLITKTIKDHKNQIKLLNAQLKRPDQKLEEWLQKLDNLDTRLMHSLQDHLQSANHAIKLISQQLYNASPIHQLSRETHRLMELYQRSQQAMTQRLTTAKLRSEKNITHLNALSPLNTLSRGYSITRNDQGETITDSAQIALEHPLHLQFFKGKVRVKVISS